MKVLFISAKDVNSKSNGGELCTNRNYLSFCELAGKENVTVINLLEKIPSGISNAIKKRLNYLLGFYEGLSAKKVNDILKIASHCDAVFIDSSIHGGLAWHLKRNGFNGKIICFFHNVELSIKIEKARLQPWKLPEIFVTKHNEKLACRHSDSIVALNKRDSAELSRIYKVNNIKIIPISLVDKLNTPVEGETSVPATFIFTGNNWYANIHGIKWFIDNILDAVDIKLQITGYKMDELKDSFNHPKIEFLGFVDDLAVVMKQADYVISPIFIGSGMKVKTCEALMYGKNFIGTSESFEGYEIDAEKVGALCNTKEEFISAINNLCSVKRGKFNKASREYFLNKYSFDATLNEFRRLIN